MKHLFWVRGPVVNSGILGCFFWCQRFVLRSWLWRLWNLGPCAGLAVLSQVVSLVSNRIFASAPVLICFDQSFFGISGATCIQRYSKFVRLGHMLPRSWIGTSVLEFWIRVLVSRARSGIMAGHLFFRFTCQKNNFNARLFPPSALFLISFPTLALPPQCWVNSLTHVFWCWAAFILSGWYIDYSNLQWIWHVCFQFVPQPSPDPATAFPNQFAC